jgi:hypothetical protein
VLEMGHIGVGSQYLGTPVSQEHSPPWVPSRVSRVSLP